MSRLVIERQSGYFGMNSHSKGKKWEDFGQKSTEGLIGFAEGLIGVLEGLIGQNKRDIGEGLIGFAEGLIGVAEGLIG